jgi:hypothetical protein
VVSGLEPTFNRTRLPCRNGFHFLTEVTTFQLAWFETQRRGAFVEWTRSDNPPTP